MKNFRQLITEASYPGNIGFEELTKYYSVANKSQIKIIEDIIKRADWEAFKKQIQNVLKIKLV